LISVVGSAASPLASISLVVFTIGLLVMRESRKPAVASAWPATAGDARAPRRYGVMS